MIQEIPPSVRLPYLRHPQRKYLPHDRPDTLTSSFPAFHLKNTTVTSRSEIISFNLVRHLKNPHIRSIFAFSFLHHPNDKCLHRSAVIGFPLAPHKNK